MGKRICFLLIWFFAMQAVKAQIPPRAQRFFNLAVTYEARKEHDAARKKMEEAIRLFPAYSEAYSLLGSWYFHDHRFHSAAQVFLKGYSNVRGGQALFSFPLAKSLIYDGRPEEALQYFPSQATESQEWARLRTTAKFILSNKNDPGADTVSLIARVSTADAELFPWISSDEQKLYLTRRKNQSDEDFYVALRDSCGGWFSARNMGRPPNSPNQEAAQMISADGHYLFFMKCENRTPNGWEMGGCDLYMSYTADSIWSAPQSFGATINTPAYEGMPCLSPDNRELYFVSDRPGGFGGQDIWVSRFEQGLWQAPRNLGREINTPANETAPFLHIDNHTLYFSSSGHPGFGGADLFMSRRVNDSLWSAPTNLGLPLNSAGDESSLTVSIRGDHAYFSSDRAGRTGAFDLYETGLPAKLRPGEVLTISGYVYDSLEQKRLNHAAIYIKEAGNESVSYQFSSNRGDGSFMITLPAGKAYHWHTSRVTYTETDSLMDLTSAPAGSALAYNIPMLPSDYVAPVNDSLIATVYFPKNSARLTDEDRQLLWNALKPWTEDKLGGFIMVNGYT
ncbi:MAG: hypothetical protein EOP49_14225, partial [Sphingobacteriales bacterium]